MIDSLANPEVQAYVTKVGIVFWETLYPISLLLHMKKIQTTDWFLLHPASRF